MTNVGSRRDWPTRWLHAFALVILAVLAVRLGVCAGRAVARAVPFERPALEQPTDVTTLGHLGDEVDRGVNEVRPNRRSREPVPDPTAVLGVILSLAILAAGVSTPAVSTGRCRGRRTGRSWCSRGVGLRCAPASETRPALGARMRRSVRRGASIASEICAQAVDTESDLVVLGASKRHTDGLFLGHTIEQVLDTCDATVVVVLTPPA